MRLYHQKIFPWVVDTFLGQKAIARLRQRMLSGVKGRVIEIGFGTGLNLEHYPATIKELVIIEPNGGMTHRALKRLQTAPFPVTVHQLKGNQLPFKDHSFDCAVSSFTLCSVDDPQAVLSEIKRLLKKKGCYHFLEHGLSCDRGIQKLQHLLNPLEKIIGDGCHINRDISDLLETHFEKIDLDEFYFKKAPKVMGYFSLGQAGS